jgi:hypothetical protein
MPAWVVAFEHQDISDFFRLFAAVSRAGPPAYPGSPSEEILWLVGNHAGQTGTPQGVDTCRLVNGVNIRIAADSPNGGDLRDTDALMVDNDARCPAPFDGPLPTPCEYSEEQPPRNGRMEAM